MINIQNVKELKELLTLENLKEKRYIHLTVGYDDMNYLEVFLSKIHNDRQLVCCDVICDDEIINYYYYYTVEELVKQISIDWELEE